MHTKRRQNNMNGGNGGGQHRHNNNRPRRFNNNRPQNEGGNDAASIARTRRNATQNRDKYLMMARDAMSHQGDRVLAENYLQHADHYHRILLSLPPEEAPRPQYLRPHDGAQGEQQQADGQQHSGEQQHHSGQDSHAQGEQHHHSAQSHEAQHTHSHTHALPSFITQPVTHSHPETPEE